MHRTDVLPSRHAVARLIPALLLALWSLPGHAAPDPAQLERNKATARRVFDDIFNHRRPEAARELYAPDFVNHGLHRNVSLEEDQAAARAEIKAFPDLRMTVDLLVAEGEFVTAMWTFRGTHTGSGYGIPTGARIEVRGVTIWRITNGRIHDEWSSFNMLSMYVQELRHLRWHLLGAIVVIGIVAFALVRRLRVRGREERSSQDRPRRTGVA